jgi:hypothetical protein
MRTFRSLVKRVQLRTSASVLQLLVARALGTSARPPLAR